MATSRSAGPAEKAQDARCDRTAQAAAEQSTAQPPSAQPVQRAQMREVEAGEDSRLRDGQGTGKVARPGGGVKSAPGADLPRAAHRFAQDGVGCGDAQALPEDQRANQARRRAPAPEDRDVHAPGAVSREPTQAQTRELGHRVSGSRQFQRRGGGKAPAVAGYSIERSACIHSEDSAFAVVRARRYPLQAPQTASLKALWQPTRSTNRRRPR